MPRDDERTVREAVRAFGLAAAALADPVPKLMADLTAPDEYLRGLERDFPIATFSPFGTLPDESADYGGEPAYPSAEATRSPGPPARPETSRSGADVRSRAAPPEDQPPIFSFRRSGAEGTPAGRRDEREGPMGTARGRFHVSEAAQEDPETPVNPAYGEMLRKERLEAMHDHGNEDSAAGASLADPMSLLDGLAEDALGAPRDVQLQPANAPPRTHRLPEPEAQDGEAAAPLESEGRSADALPVSVGGRRDATGTAHLGTTKDFSEDEPYGGGVQDVIHSLVEDLFSTSTPDEPSEAEVNAPEVEERSDEMVAPDRSAFAALNSAFHEPDGQPVGYGIIDDEVLEKAPEHYADPEAFAELINDVLVRQARRHGVDLS